MRFPAFDDLLTLTVGTADRDEGHGLLLTFGCSQDEAQCDINLSRSPLLEHYLGWDREPAATAWETFATRLTAADRSQSLATAGTREGVFRVVYRFENEQLLELINRTAHAGALSALVETAHAYRFYFGVYVRRVGRFTPVYMALIDPVRKLVVYPALLRSVRARWHHTFGTA